ncbi:helix-turn-helix domain-containing protein [uncultured Oscillibacter sp.]|uniref:helix-turn-helix domain-containing protein n=1 Tax=uncultured Oscillibacter sp. TaxID=876091 RepID=UPI00345CC202
MIGSGGGDKPRKYTLRSKEEKLSVVKRNLAGESACSLAGELGCSDSQVRSWVKAYQAEGEAGLEQKKKPGNPLSRYERRKELSYEESLQYQVELPKRGLVRKDAEVLRLKNGTNEKGAMPEKDDPADVC